MFVARQIVDRRRKMVEARKNRKILKPKEVTEGMLKKNGVSWNQFKQIQMLMDLKKDIFHDDFGRVIDLTQYPKAKPEHKALLYRPPKMKSLQEAYWKLNGVQKSQEQPEEYTPIYPKK